MPQNVTKVHLFPPIPCEICSPYAFSKNLTFLHIPSHVKSREKVTMKLEHYFDFLSPEDIRIKDTRVGIETILSDYLNGCIPEEMALHYPAVSLE